MRLNLPPSVDRRIIVSSDRRHAAMNKLPKPLRKEDVLAILGDQSDDDFPIFRDNGYVVTLAAGKKLLLNILIRKQISRVLYITCYFPFYTTDTSIYELIEILYS